MAKLGDASMIYLGSSESSRAYIGDDLAWEPAGEPESDMNWDWLLSDLDYDTQYIRGGSNPLWQYTKIEGGL